MCWLVDPSIPKSSKALENPAIGVQSKDYHLAAAKYDTSTEYRLAGGGLEKLAEVVMSPIRVSNGWFWRPKDCTTCNPQLTRWAALNPWFAKTPFAAARSCRRRFGGRAGPTKEAAFKIVRSCQSRIVEAWNAGQVQAMQVNHYLNVLSAKIADLGITSYQQVYRILEISTGPCWIIETESLWWSPNVQKKQEHAMNIHEHFECNNFLYDSIFGDVPFQIGGAQTSQQNRLVFKLANLGQRTRTTYVPTVGFVAFWRADVSCDRQHTNGQQALPALLALSWGRSSSGEGGCGLALDQARTEIQRTVKNFEANRSDRWWMDPISTRNNSTWNHLV